MKVCDHPELCLQPEGHSVCNYLGAINCVQTAIEGRVKGAP